jgi:enoyl-CoA hydratase/carnithine racemase
VNSTLVRTALDAGIFTVTLTRSEKRNALSPELFEAIGEAFGEADQPDVRVVLVEGEGPVFCAGIDTSSLASLAGGDDGFTEAGTALQNIFMALERSGKPSLVAVQGAAVGAGLQLALACDLRVAAADARLGLFEIRYGIIPDLGGIHRMVQLCGPARAKDLVLTGREVGAEEALRIGLVDRVVPATEVSAVAHKLAEEIAGRAPLAVGAGKRMVDAAAAGQAPTDNLRAVLQEQVRLLGSADFAEAVGATLQKREPVFTRS